MVDSARLFDGAKRRGPSKRIRAATEDKILAVEPTDIAPGGRVPAGPTWRNIDRLLAAGWTKTAIARRLGQTNGGLQLSRVEVQARHARAVAALLDETPPDRVDSHGNVTSFAEPDLMPTPAQLAYRFETTRGRVHNTADDEWTAHAACRDMNPDIFFPTRGEDVRPAKRVCAGCPVRQQCLDYALDNQEKYGIWGGTGERERRRLRRERGIPIDPEEHAA